ncbi:MAG: oligogalacturonate lyase family protein [Sediminibacterium sp.]
MLMRNFFIPEKHMQSSAAQRVVISLLFILVLFVESNAQPVMETGGQKMPNEWIDKSTSHRVTRLTRQEGSSMSFYFHNNPFIGNKMVFYNSSLEQPGAVTDMKRETYNLNVKNKQLYIMDLKTLATEQLTHESSPMNGEIISAKRKEIFYQVKDSVYSVNVETKKRKLLFVFPADFKGGITTVNADGTLLAGARSTDAEKEISIKNPEKKDFFNLIFEARLPRTLFTINVATGKLVKLFTDSAWLNHVQFSSTDPSLLMFCHEGPWHKLDRIWTININTKKITLMHKRTMDMEIAGHEWFGSSGNRIWFDLQQPRGETFFVAGSDVKNTSEVKYKVERNDWSVHYTSSEDEKTFAGDGGHPGSVAKAPDGQWINFFTVHGDQLHAEKLVSMKHHDYKLEPNVHFSPDGKWIIFRANFEGTENIYAVEIKKS